MSKPFISKAGTAKSKARARAAQACRETRAKGERSRLKGSGRRGNLLLNGKGGVASNPTIVKVSLFLLGFRLSEAREETEGKSGGGGAGVPPTRSLSK